MKIEMSQSTSEALKNLKKEKDREAKEVKKWKKMTEKQKQHKKSEDSIRHDEMVYEREMEKLRRSEEI